MHALSSRGHYGQAVDTTRLDSGVLVSRMPEPSAAVLVLLGLGGLVAVRRRSRR